MLSTIIVLPCLIWKILTVKCFTEEEPTTEEVTTTELPTTMEATTTTRTTTTTLHPTTTTPLATTTTTTTTEPSTTTTTLQPTTTTLKPTTTPKPTTTTLQPTTTTHRPTTTTLAATTTTTQPTTTTTFVSTLPPEDSKYSSTANLHIADLVKKGSLVNPDHNVPVTNGPVGFGWGADFAGNKETGSERCLKFDGADGDDDQCLTNPMNCDNGISVGIWAKITYYRSDKIARYVFSTGGHDDGTPGISVYYRGIYLYAIVSTANKTWSAYGAGLTRNHTWNHLGIVWSMEKGLELYVNARRAAFVVYPQKSVGKSPLLPPMITVGCRRLNADTFAGFSYGEYDELVVWKKALDETNINYFLGETTCDPELHPLSCETDTNILLQKFDEVNLNDPAVLGKSLKHLNKVSGVLNQPSQDSSEEDYDYSEDVGESKRSETIKNLMKLLRKVLKKTGDAPPDKKFSKQTRPVIQEVKGLLSNLFSPSEADVWKQLQKNEEGSAKLVNELNTWLMKKLSQANNTDGQIEEEIITDNVVTSLTKKSLEELQQETGKYIYFPNYFNSSNIIDNLWNETTDYIRIPTAIFRKKKHNDVSLIGSIYDTFHKISPLQNSVTGIETDLVYLDSRVISYSVNPAYDRSVLRKDPIVVYLEHEDYRESSRSFINDLRKKPKKMIYDRFCVRWDQSLRVKGYRWRGGWTTNGCKVAQTSDASTKCHCNQLGMFAILTVLEKESLFLPIDSVSEAQWVRIVKWIGFEISAVLLVIYIFLIAIKQSLHDQFHLIRLNTAIAALAALLSFFCIDFKWQDKKSCRIISGFAHFFYMAVGTWLVIEAHALFAAIIMGVVGGRIMCYVLIGWGIPAILLGTFIGMYSNYGEDYRCLVGPTTDMRWSFVGPVLSLAGLALLWSMIIICNLNTPAITVGVAVEELSAAARGLFSVSFVFVVTWVFGKLAFVDMNIHKTRSFDYLFQIINSFLGVFIVILMGIGSRHFRYGATTGDSFSLKMAPKRNQVAPKESPSNSVEQEDYSKTFVG